MSFQIHALPARQFAHLFEMSDQELAAQNARREVVAVSPGSPCRVSLEDAKVGEEVLLLNYEHQAEATPFRASHAIFVRRGAAQAFPERGEAPDVFRSRLISLRAFNADHIMIDADAVVGVTLETTITRLFGIPGVEYLHLHYAKPGCFAARVTRA
ncbi:MAG: DUF1203 domain-containing protein [Rhodobacteraceae bacterium]|nr:DUF1203 domain-containing protein [Paracoccaceae bacterium]